MTGQPGTGGSRPHWPAFGRIEGRGLARRPPRISRSVAAATRSAWRDDDAGRVGHDRVEQLDLETDDRMDPDGLRCADETDRAIEAVMVRDGQPGQSQFDGSLDQVVGRGCPVEEREIGVAMKFGVRGLRHGSLRSEKPAGRGLATIEHLFSLGYPSPGHTPDQIPIRSTKKDETR